MKSFLRDEDDEDNDEQVEEDISTEERDNDVQESGENEIHRDDSTEEGSDSDKHTLHFHFEPDRQREEAPIE